MYQAIVAKIKTRPHPNADKIQLGDVLGNQVVIGLDIQDGELGIYFPVDGVLSHDFCVMNDLYNQSARTELQLVPTTKLGFFDTKRRIRAQKFRGEKSDGLWMPMTCLFWLDHKVNGLVEGTMFDTWGGQKICEKWYSQRTFIASAIRKTKKGEVPNFPKHMDTDQWAYFKDQINPLSIITISEKLHGTSHRFGLVLDADRKWWQFWKPKYKRVDGSRNVVIGASSGQGYYGSDQFRFNATATPTPLIQGEVLYGEVVGFTTEGQPIMPSANVSKKDLPMEYDLYGPIMHYHYGVPPGKATFFLYRVVRFNDEGVATELSDPQVRKRARELGFECPPLLYCGVLGDGDHNQADMIVRSLTGDTSLPSLVDKNQIREGVIVRVDDPHGGTKFYKSKSFAFKLLEGIIKSNESYEDMEEIS